MDMRGLCDQHGIRAHVREGAPDNPEFRDSDGWTVTLRRGGDGRKQLTVPFYMGIGHHGREPEADEVLDCLLSDARAFENARDFADFASELGYSEDSRKAEWVYRECGRIAKRLRRFLGDLFDEFMEAERL